MTVYFHLASASRPTLLPHSFGVRCVALCGASDGSPQLSTSPVSEGTSITKKMHYGMELCPLCFMAWDAHVDRGLVADFRVRTTALGGSPHVWPWPPTIQRFSKILYSKESGYRTGQLPVRNLKIVGKIARGMGGRPGSVSLEMEERESWSKGTLDDMRMHREKFGNEEPAPLF